MKKLLIILASIIALSCTSHAQRFTIGAAIGLTNGPTPQFSLMIGANDLVKALFIGVDARLEGNLNLGSSAVVSLGAAVLGTVNLGIVTVIGFAIPTECDDDKHSSWSKPAARAQN